MDVGMHTPDGAFSLRAAALIIQNHRLLAVKHDRYACFYTIGGGVHVNETSADAVVREVYEETGYRLSVERLAFVQERFYDVNKARHHEVVFFYLMKPADLRVENGTRTDHSEEKLYWLPVDELRSVDLVPGFLRGALSGIPGETVHIISKD